MIVAGEASGDLHGANLARALTRLAPESSICGMGGTAMAEAGVEILYDAARMAVVGLIEVISHFSDIRAARLSLLTELRDNRPDLLILIDYPGFNLMLAEQAKNSTSRSSITSVRRFGPGTPAGSKKYAAWWSGWR